MSSSSSPSFEAATNGFFVFSLSLSRSFSLSHSRHLRMNAVMPGGGATVCPVRPVETAVVGELDNRNALEAAAQGNHAVKAAVP